MTETTPRMPVKTIAVIGTGTMGAGIAQAAALGGAHVIMHDVEQRFIDRARKTIEESLSRFAKKGVITADQQQQIRSLIASATDLAAVEDADVVIEAITENMLVKKQLFHELDAICADKTVFATNTSSLSVAEMAQATRRPDRFLGLHFFNPVPLMKLVEVVRTIHTSEQTVALGVAMAEAMGKEPIVTKDKPGFIFNRLILPYLNEAAWALCENVGNASDVDRAMRLGGNMPIGPLALLDLIGLDVMLHACTALFEEFGDPKFRICPLIRSMVRAGLLGKKSGQGFYDYSAEPPTVVDLSAL